MADELSAARIDDLQYKPGVPFRDEVLWHLTLALLPALENPESASSLFVTTSRWPSARMSRMPMAASRGPRLPRPAAAAWRPGRSAAPRKSSWRNWNRTSRSIVWLPNASCRHPFARAFRQTTGMPPHRWLLARRVDRAKELLAASPMRLADIALACGFADQSHFTKVFTRMAGTSPGAWRREHLTHRTASGKRRVQPGPPDPTDDPLAYFVAHGLRKWGGGTKR